MHFSTSYNRLPGESQGAHRGEKKANQLLLFFVKFIMESSVSYSISGFYHSWREECFKAVAFMIVPNDLYL